MAQMTYLEAIRQGLWEEMERDERVCIFGEDIGAFGGPFKITKGFIEKFGDKRVVDMPIAEAGFVGVATGAAIYGMRPVVEFQFIDFIPCAFNMIVNMAAKYRFRIGDPVPMVIRGPCGAGHRTGPYHAQHPEMWFVKTPGLKVVCPATPADAKGLIKAAIRDDDPVIYLEHKGLYRKIKDEVPDGEQLVPLGKARVVREGRDVTLVTYGAQLYTALEALKRLEDVSVELIDLRSLVPLDQETILQSVRKTNRLIILHEDSRTGGIAGEIAMRVMENAFDSLAGPIVRITSQDCPVPQAGILEDEYLPQVEDVEKAVRKLMRF